MDEPMQIKINVLNCLFMYRNQHISPTSAMSCVFQAISAQDEKLSHTMFLPLAERMVEKMVKEEKIEAEAEVGRVIDNLFLFISAV